MVVDAGLANDYFALMDLFTPDSKGLTSQRLHATWLAALDLRNVEAKFRGDPVVSRFRVAANIIVDEEALLVYTFITLQRRVRSERVDDRSGGERLAHGRGA